MRPEFLFISVYIVGSGPRVLAGRKSALTPIPPSSPAVYSTGRFKVVVLVLFLLFVVLCSIVIPHSFLFFFFCFFFYIYMCCDACIVVKSPIAAHFAFCFTSCVVMLAFLSLQQLPVLLSLILVVMKSGIGTQDEVSPL